jgi:hypothetical protein
LFDWVHDSRRLLALWLLVAIGLHAGAYALFRLRYPAPETPRISNATLYVLPPGSPQAARLAPFLAAADPALLAPERYDPSVAGVEPAIPPYQPSYAAAAPELAPLPDPQHRILPPLLRDFGPVPIADAVARRTPLPPPHSATRIQFSAELLDRAPREIPKAKFTARPGDSLPAASFLISVAPDGRVLQVLPEGTGPNEALIDAASRLLMRLRFARGRDSRITWGAATFHWGLDVKREEPR